MDYLEKMMYKSAHAIQKNLRPMSENSNPCRRAKVGNLCKMPMFKDWNSIWNRTKGPRQYMWLSNDICRWNSNVRAQTCNGSKSRTKTPTKRTRPSFRWKQNKQSHFEFRANFSERARSKTLHHRDCNEIERAGPSEEMGSKP